MLTNTDRINYLIKCLENPRMDKAARAERRLIAVGETAVEPLITATESPSKETRLRAAWALGKIGDPRGFNAIMRLTNDRDDFVAYEAAWALGYLKDERAVAPLIDMVCHGEDTGAAGGAAQALDLIGVAAIAPLLDVLKNCPPEAKITAAYTLAAIGDELAIEPIAKLLDSPDPDLRIAAVESLAHLASERKGEIAQRCLDLLEKHADDPVERVRDNARFWVYETRNELENPITEEEMPKPWATRLLASEKRDAKERKSWMARAHQWRRIRKKLSIRRFSSSAPNVRGRYRKKILK